MQRHNHRNRENQKKRREKKMRYGDEQRVYASGEPFGLTDLNNLSVEIPHFMLLDLGDTRPRHAPRNLGKR